MSVSDRLSMPLPLSSLKRDPVNVRKTDIDPTPQFISSVREHGILEPLTVRENGDGYLVTNGGKRLAVLQALVKEGKLEPGTEVPCIVLRAADDRTARDVSLAVNYMRETMHPVDEYEAFAELLEDGLSREDIGKRYGLKKREVDQVLALGHLAPEVRQAWRKGDIEEEAAQEFTERERAEKAAATRKEQQGPAISAALSERLSSAITLAAAGVLESNPQLALAALAASLSGRDGPVCISQHGGNDRRVEDDDEDRDFADRFSHLAKKNIADLAKVIAKIVAGALDMGGHSEQSLPLAEDCDDEDRVLLEALDPKKLNAELRKTFDAADYFTGVTAQACKDAILLCDPKQPLTGKEKKSELAKLAAELVAKSNAGGKAGYLPPEMRTKHYDGPAAKAAAKAAKTAPKAAAKPKAKTGARKKAA